MQTQKISGVVNIPYHVKRLNITTKAVPGDVDEKGFEAINEYATLEVGSNRFAMAIRNVTRQNITLKKGMIIATVAATNVIPPMLAPNPSTYLDVPKYRQNEPNGNCVPNYTGMYLCQVDAETAPSSSKIELTDGKINKLFSKLILSTIKSW